jgi:hypothetical protein
MINVTLDKNLLIDLELERQPWFDNMEKIRKLGEEGKIIISIPSIMASERPKFGKKRIRNFSGFIGWVNGLGFTKAVFLSPIGYYDVTFWNHCLWSGPDLQKLELKIHNILVPSQIPISSPPTELWDKWINRKCDVLTVWSHIWYETDMLVTRDGKIINNSKKLKLVGAKIMSLDNVIKELENTGIL